LTLGVTRPSLPIERLIERLVEELEIINETKNVNVVTT
jgi:hypothetical protein